MYISVDLSQIPPATTLHEADDVTRLKVVLSSSDHAWVSREALGALEGAKPEDEAWCERVDGMFAYAASKGWLDERAHVRAHVESQQ